MQRALTIVGAGVLSFVLLCCGGTTVVAAVFGEPKPSQPGAAAAQQGEPIVAGPNEEPTSEAPVLPVDPASPSPAPPASPSPAETSPAPSPKVETRTVTETATIKYGERTVKDPNLAEGKRVIRTKGVNGVRTLTYQVTLTDGVQTGRKLIKSVVSKQPVTQVVAVGTKQERQCHPGYGGCVPIASDVDCAGGSGNGPAYVTGPVKVLGDDPYDLDRDNDGYGCDD
ncbi:G5 domain-containing protein [Micromonospora sp. WMMD812]|uniref:G5 domain-containing protein n=1 Tax=Micromonospora sp. WMMD812 TaxID=3015152 RepID=UPI00248B50A2|nr:G5 domain-containing protein [Micromonospora sp. WMMD812]WBB64888.1 G5 domain-containing protein [Micromonospora sp. WMMD812]